MALIVDDRVRETTDVIGTGAIALLGPVTGHQAFAVIGNSNTTYYCIADQGGPNWEVGIGTYASAGNTLTRTTVLESSNANALVSFTAGVKDVFVTYPASKSVYKDASNQVTLASQLNLTNASNYNLYASGAGANYFAGSLGIGTPISGGIQGAVRLASTLTGNVSSHGIVAATTIQSDVTTTSTQFLSAPSTAVASFTLTTIEHFRTSGVTIGAGSVVTNQYGYKANSTLTAAANNYGFYGDIAASVGTNRYNLYMGGTADNYLAGSLGIGGSDARAMVNVGGSIVTGAGIEYFRAGGTSPSTATAYIIPFHSEVTTPASATTFAELTSFKAQPATTGANSTITLFQGFAALGATLGATSTITNQYGYFAAATLTTATNNYSFYGNIPSGSNRYNLYMGGTAPNYLAGDLQLAKTITAAGTTGAQTINKTTGTVNFAAGAVSLVVTNSLVTANSIIIATVGSNDTAMKSVAVVAAAGSFTLYADVTPTAETRVNFLITN